MKIGNNYAFNRYFKNQSNVVENNFELENATVGGVGTKTLILLLTTLITSMLVIGITIRVGANIFLYLGAFVLTFILQLIICFSPLKAKSLSIPYAISEGLVIGSICGLLELVLPDMGLQIAGIALLVTLSVFTGAIIVYRKGLIRADNRFYGFLLAFTFGAAIFSVVFGIMAFITFFTSGINLWAMFYFSGFGLLIAVIMCVVAALYVVASLKTADQMIQSGASKDYEWYASYAITVNVICLFLEILRLIIIIVGKSSRNK